ncbi:Rha family transcriptional regulator [Photorhabdus noenieputensis]|uniref:Rha family transcriptional regulator n=1 Tax=Photorhabdus noenieputensis TaxID=1208607 RepID=UPI001FD11B31|nr:Rha family transcriptional regulator [Photorhabdus noenieputensis]MCK3670949.1 Rha family transcriptional regulator [Photorhabdus noenieputensis]
MTNITTTSNQTAMMSSREIAELTNKTVSNIHVDIWSMAKELYSIHKDDWNFNHHKNQHVRVVKGVITVIDNRGYTFELLLNRRHTEILITGYDVMRRAAVIDRWFTLESGTTKPKSQAEFNLAYALAQVEQERRFNQVAEKVEEVSETIEHIKQGAIPAGWVGYSLLRVKCGLTDAKCRTLAEVYNVPTDSITILTPDGQPRPMKIVFEEDFMSVFRLMMSEAEQRKSKWYHPKMGLFQIIGWEEKQ